MKKSPSQRKLRRISRKLTRQKNKTNPRKRNFPLVILPILLAGLFLYSELDRLGRCGVAMANLSPALMPTEERGPIGMVKPSGWHTVKYPELIEDVYLYNRCHLIAFPLADENANEKNMITGTRYFNVQGMQVFERKVAE